MAQSHPKNYSVIAVVAFVLCLVGGYFLYNNFWSDYNSAKAQHTQAQADNTRLKQALASVQTFLNDYKNQVNNVELTNLALPTKNSDMANFISSLSGLAQNSGVVLSNFQIDTTGTDTIVPSHAIKSQTLSVTASSIYPSFTDFILRLEDHLRLVDITHINVSSSNSTVTGANATPPLQYQIKLKTYYQQQ